MLGRSLPPSSGSIPSHARAARRRSTKLSRPVAIFTMMTSTSKRARLPNGRGTRVSGPDSVELDLLSMESSAVGTDEIARIREANRRYLARFKDNASILAVIQQVSTFDPEVRETRVNRQDAFAALIERRIRKLQQEGRAD